VNQLEERAGRVADNVGAFMSDAEVSGKIKSKMALDELVRARTIDVSTAAGVVTLAGTVTSGAEHDRAVQLAASRGVGSLWAEARSSALGFYERAGWTAEGDEWIKPGIGPHRHIHLDLRPGADS
jgi:hypothetical protein